MVNLIETSKATQEALNYSDGLAETIIKHNVVKEKNVEGYKITTYGEGGLDKLLGALANQFGVTTVAKDFTPNAKVEMGVGGIGSENVEFAWEVEGGVDALKYTI